MRFCGLLAPILVASASASIAVAQPTEAALTGKTGSDDYNEVVAAWRKGEIKKIIGGKDASDKAYPWQVSLGVSWIPDSGPAHFCGGTIYRAQWIITAAHCVRTLTKDEIVVVAGATELNRGKSRLAVETIIPHPQYDHVTKNNDIALVRLKAPLTFSDHIRAAQLITADEEKTLALGSDLTVTGWGATYEGGDPVRPLQYVGVDFIDRTTCNKPLSYGGRVTENMLCAGKYDQPQEEGDACQGDSGGPLVIHGQPKLVAVVSWGQGCAQPLKYGVYARVSPYAGWIAGIAP